MAVLNSLAHELPAGDPRQWLIERLDTYAERWPRERTTSDLRDFVLRRQACFERTCFEDGHITGSAWVVCPNRERTILTHHKKLNKWLQLGGHSDGESNTLRVAQREAEEEAGIAVFVVDEQIFDLDIHVIPSRGSDPAHKHYDVRFLFYADDSQSLTISSESKDLRWVPLSDLQQLTTEESVLRMMRKTY